MPAKTTALERWSKIVIGCGLGLIFLQVLMEFGILATLLVRAIVKPETYFDWKPPGIPYIGLAVLVVGAAMLVFAAMTARRDALPNPPHDEPGSAADASG